MIGHFGFDTEYRNCVTLLGKSSCAEIERIFTIPADMENEIKIIENGQKKGLKVPPADCFGLFLSKVLAGIRRNSFEEFYDTLLSDSRVLGRLRRQAALA